MKKLLVFSLFILISSCTKNGTSTGDPIVSLKVNGSSSLATVARLDLWQKIMQFIIPSAVAGPASIEDSGARTVALTNFWTTLGEIEFELTEVADSGEVDGDSIEFNGPFTTDMLQTNVSAVGTAAISQTQIRRIKAKMIRTSTLPTGAPAPLLNNSVYISGTVNGVAFTVSSAEETAMAVAGPNAVTATSGADLLLQLQIANLFKSIDLGAITVSTDISESNRVPVANPCPNIEAGAADLYTCFRKGLEIESNFGSDNGDNELNNNDDTVK